MDELKCYRFGTSGQEGANPSLVMNGQQAAFPQIQTREDSQGKRVLIVDDDGFFLRVTATKLRSAGFQVRTARESSEAIAALGEQPADTVLIDIYFPPNVGNGGMGSWDGFQLMSWLRGNSSARTARFIIVSRSDSAADRQRAQQLGAVAWLQKPLDYDRLVAVVKGQN